MDTAHALDNYCLVTIIYTDSVITTIPDEVVDGVLTLCPGTTFSLTCSYGPSNQEITRWEISGPMFTMFLHCVRLVPHRPPNNRSCDPFTINAVSNYSLSTRSSTAHATATNVLDGAVVLCRDGSDQSDPEVGKVTIRIIGE